MKADSDYCVVRVWGGQVPLLSWKLLLNIKSINLFIHVCHPSIRYQINARTELAVRYNDISPLENHHCAVAFQILSLPECNIFANVDLDAFKQIRQVRCACNMASLILILHSINQKTVLSRICLKQFCSYISRQLSPSFWPPTWPDTGRY